MPVVLPIVLGYAAAIIWIIIGKGNTRYDKIIYKFLKKNLSHILFFLRFLSIPNLILSSILILLMPVMKFGDLINSVLSLGIIIAELQISIVDLNATKAYKEE